MKFTVTKFKHKNKPCAVVKLSKLTSHDEAYKTIYYENHKISNNHKINEEGVFTVKTNKHQKECSL